MINGKNVLTTGEVAKICHVAPRTVSKWFDSGKLKGYRIPGSKDRRIPTNELLRFMKAHDMPIEGLTFGQLRIMIVDNAAQTDTLADALHQKKDYDVRQVKSAFETGIQAHKYMPHVILIHTNASGIDAGEIARLIRSDPELAAIKLIAAAQDMSDEEGSELLSQGFDGYVNDMQDIHSVITRIEEVTAIIY